MTRAVVGMIGFAAVRRRLLRLVVGVFCLFGVGYGQQLLPGARIEIVCEQEPSLSVARTISPQGEITLPILGRIVIAGKTVSEAERYLEERAMAKLGLDRVLVSISLLEVTSGPVEFFGAVTRSGSVPYRPGLTLDDVIKLALPQGTPETDTLEITGSTGKRIVVDVSRAQTILLRPGDRIFFPRATAANEVYVLGGVERPGAKTYVPGMTVRAAIGLGGGVTGHGLANKIRVERKSGDTRVVALDTPDADLLLGRGDIVTVPTVENGRFVTVSGVVMKPGEIEFREGMTLSEAIRAAGGAGLFSSGDVVVKRIGQWKRSFNLNLIRSKKSEDLVLLPGDILDVQPGRWHKASDPSKPAPKERTHPVVPPK